MGCSCRVCWPLETAAPGFLLLVGGGTGQLPLNHDSVRVPERETNQIGKSLGCRPRVGDFDIYSAGWGGDQRQAIPALAQLRGSHFYSELDEASEKLPGESGAWLPLVINRISPGRAPLKSHPKPCYSLHWDRAGKAAALGHSSNSRLCNAADIHRAAGRHGGGLFPTPGEGKQYENILIRHSFSPEAV